jgi:hypothetical protein
MNSSVVPTGLRSLSHLVPALKCRANFSASLWDAIGLLSDGIPSDQRREQRDPKIFSAPFAFSAVRNPLHISMFGKKEKYDI